MGKRGQKQLVMHTLTGLVVAAILVIHILLILKSVSSSNALEREYLAKDLALLLDTAYASPGEIEYIYALPGTLDIRIKENKVTVIDREKGLEASYPFASNKEFTEQTFETDTRPRAIKISKSGGTVLAEVLFDENEKDARETFQDFTALAGKINQKSYNFECAEEISLELTKGYYVTVSESGDATLRYTDGEIARDLATGKMPKIAHMEEKMTKDFYISPKEWKPSIGISKGYSQGLLLYNGDLKIEWMWASPTIKLNELPKCEAESIRKGK